MYIYHDLCRKHLKIWVFFYDGYNSSYIMLISNSQGIMMGFNSSYIIFTSFINVDAYKIKSKASKELPLMNIKTNLDQEELRHLI